MNKELYFLRSSEQKIVTDMFKHAHPNKSDELSKYTEHYGLSLKDLGIYVLVEGEIAGAIWSRKFDGDAASTLSVAIIEKFQDQGVDSFMMEQFLQEAAALYEELIIDLEAKPETIAFYESFGFTQTAEKFMLNKKLQRKEVVRPSDGYDPRKWMD
jgi:ribosomal protein S18 acetylase RimI-like enzyme